MARGPKFVVLMSGKRKTGKDFCAHALAELLKARNYTVLVTGVSYSLKKEYAEKNGLDYELLLSDAPYKEQYRKEMISWGEEIRGNDPGYFCKAAIPDSVTADVVIVSDCRRCTDMHYFEQQKFNGRTLSVRIVCTDGSRKARGFMYNAAVDAAPSECSLDRWDFDTFIENNNKGMLSLLEEEEARKSSLHLCDLGFEDLGGGDFDDGIHNSFSRQDLHFTDIQPPTFEALTVQTGEAVPEPEVFNIDYNEDSHQGEYHQAAILKPATEADGRVKMDKPKGAQHTLTELADLICEKIEILELQ